MWNWAGSFKIPQPLSEGLRFPFQEFLANIDKKTKFIIKLLLMKICYTYV